MQNTQTKNKIEEIYKMVKELYDTRPIDTSKFKLPDTFNCKVCNALRFGINQRLVRENGDIKYIVDCEICHDTNTFLL